MLQCVGMSVARYRQHQDLSRELSFLNTYRYNLGSILDLIKDELMLELPDVHRKPLAIYVELFGATIRF